MGDLLGDLTDFGYNDLNKSIRWQEYVMSEHVPNLDCKSAGAMLREARAEQSRSLTDAAEFLCLRKALVVALEEDDYEQWSCWVYYRGHLKRYAKWLGLDYEVVKQALLPQCMQIFKSDDFKGTHTSAMYRKVNQKRWLMAGTLISFVAALLIFFIFSFFHHNPSTHPSNTPIVLPIEENS